VLVLTDVEKRKSLATIGLQTLNGPACTGYLITASQLIQGSYVNTNKIGLTLFWAMTQRVVVIPYRRFGIAYQSHLQYHCTVRNKPEERISHLLPRRKTDIKLGLPAGKSVCVLCVCFVCCVCVFCVLCVYFMCVCICAFCVCVCVLCLCFVCCVCVCVRFVCVLCLCFVCCVCFVCVCVCFVCVVFVFCVLCVCCFVCVLCVYYVCCVCVVRVCVCCVCVCCACLCVLVLCVLCVLCVCCVYVVNLCRQDALIPAGGKELLQLNLLPEHEARSCSLPLVATMRLS